MKKWVIKKSRHYSLSNFWLRLFPSFGFKTKSYQFQLDESCWYAFSDADDYDINKLFGYSYGMHHVNSTRIGWRPNFDKKDTFDLFIYNYNDKIRTMQLFANVNSNQKYRCYITPTRKSSYFTYALAQEDFKILKVMDLSFNFPVFSLGYPLWFYFGGNKTCSLNIFAFIGRIK